MILSNRFAYFIVALLLAIHSGLLAYSATLHSPTLNEPGHLVAGLTHWKFGRFEVYRVNPPLTHYVAAIPVRIAGYKEDWSGFSDAPGARPEFRMGADFIKANGERSIWLFTLARWAMIPFSLAGALFCFFWSRELWGGNLAGLISLWFWCFEPFLLGHAELITPDVPATALGLGATYTYWRWLKGPRWSNAAIAGACLGLAELTKTSWIILFGLWPLLFSYWIATENRDNTLRATPALAGGLNPLIRATQLGLILMLAIYLINLLYDFDGTFTQMKDFQFVSKTLTGLPKAGDVGNRFVGSWLGEVPSPFPMQYVSGIDLQKKDFEDYNQQSYLLGEWKHGGWWYYYLYGLAMKTTHGLQAALLLMVFVIFKKWVNQSYQMTTARPQEDGLGKWSGWNRESPKDARPCDVAILLTPPVVILAMVSSQLEFNHHVRYVMPVLGHSFVLLGALTVWWKPASTNTGFRLSAKLLSAIAALSVSASLAQCLPHQLAFFNALSGGTHNGYRNLLHSNVDWCQDLLLLKEWVDAHPHSRPLLFETSNLYEAEHIGLDVAPRGMISEVRRQSHWRVVSVNELQKRGSLYRVTGTLAVPDDDVLRDQLLTAEEVARIGWTLRVYHLDDTTTSNNFSPQ